MKTRLAALPVAVVTLAVLSGCAPGLPSLPNSVESIIEQATGGSVDVGGNVNVPSGWPNLPLPQGELISAISVDQTFSLTYTIPSAAAADALLVELASAGFSTESEADYGGFRTHILTDGVLSVTVGVMTDGEAVTLIYSSTPKG